MSDLIKKIKNKFLGTETFNVGFNNKSPVKGVSRKASPLNGYTPASASFDGSKGAISSYGHLMQSNYGQPEVPDLADMGKILSDAVGKFGKAAGQLGAAYQEAEEGADNGEGGGNWWNQRRSSKKSVSRKSSSPLNQFGTFLEPPPEDLSGDQPGEIQIDTQDNVEGANEAKENFTPNTNEGLDPKIPPGKPNETDTAALIEFCSKPENANSRLCSFEKSVNKNWDDMSSSERINDSRLKWD